MARGLAGLFFLALAVSLDGLSAGVSYGLRHIRLDWRSLTMIGLVAGVTALASTGGGHLLGRLLGRQLGAAFGRQLGAALLLALGLASLGNVWQEKENESPGPPVGEAGPLESGNGRRTLWSLQLRTWGLVVEVARQPGRADLDRSGSISLPEALILGLALSLDSGAVGFGAGMAGFPPWGVAAAVAPTNVALLWCGTWIGRRLIQVRRRVWLALSPGLILLALGVWRLKP
ncbi:MAG: manganese efflux pump [Bacillota bacterium]|nr:manganese efflux pump [Bacillota bacterium]